jgi:hypothetical protein
MSAADIPELEHDVRAAVREAKRFVDPGEDVRARMRARLRATLSLMPDGDGGGGGEAAGAARDARPGAPAAPGAGLSRGALPTFATFATFAVGLAVGGVAGLLYPRAPVERIVTVQAPVVVAASSVAPSASPSMRTVAPSDLPSAAAVVAGPASFTASPRPGSDLEAERALLDVARTALGRGEGAHSLGACDEHARRFPRGALGEEREAIAVQALVLEHREGEAKARAERFRKTHPRSILLPAVRAAAGVEP